MTFAADNLEWKSRHIKKGRNKAKKKKKVTSCSIGTRSSNADLSIQNLEFILTIIRENHITFVDPKITSRLQLSEQ